MRRPLLAFIVLLVLLSGVLAPLAGAFSVGQQDRVVVGSCSLKIAAVSSAGEGVLSDLSVIVLYPGEGRVYISTSPATQVDTQGAAWIAAFAASIVAGVDLGSYDFVYTIEAPSIIVGGPSAGAAMAVATLAALQGIDCPRDRVVTGMVYPDSTIGPVGGLLEKLEAVADAGGKVFVIPPGQSTYVYYERRVTRIGPIAFVTTTPVEVDLVEEGRSRGVRVVEAPDIVRAAEEILGVSPGQPTTGSTAPQKSLDLARVYETLHDEASKYAEKASNVRSDVYELYVERALEDLRRAESLYGEGLVIGAITSLESSLSNLLTALWLDEALKEDLEVTRFVDQTLSHVNEVYEQSLGSRSEALALASIELFEAASAASRALEELVNESGKYYLPVRVGITGRVAVVDPLEALASAYARSLAAKLLLEAGGGTVTIDAAKRRVLESLSKSMTAYALTLFQESGSSSPLLEKALKISSTAVSEKSELLALYLSMWATSYATAAIHGSFDKSTATLERALERADNLAASSGSSTAPYLLEQARAEAENGDPSNAWVYLEMAILSSWLLTERGEATNTPSTGGEAGSMGKPARTETVTEVETVTETSTTTITTTISVPTNRGPGLPASDVAIYIMVGFVLGMVIAVLLRQALG